MVFGNRYLTAVVLCLCNTDGSDRRFSGRFRTVATHSKAGFGYQLVLRRSAQSENLSIFYELRLWHAVRYTAAEVLHLMNTTKLRMTVKSFGLAAAMVLGLMVFAGTGVNAQNRQYNGNNGRYDQDQQDDRYNNQQDDRYNGQDDRYNGRDRNGNQSYRFAY